MHSISSVLLIEDNPGDARLVTEILSERYGDACAVHTASTLACGLKALRDTRVDVLLLDLALPDSRGMETFVEVRAAAPRMPIVILSGDDNDALAIEALRAGAQDYLPKKRAGSEALLRAMVYAVARRLAADAHTDAQAEASRDNEVRDSTRVERTPDGVLQVDTSGSIRFANAHLANMLGVAQPALTGRSLLEFVDPAHREALANLLATPPGVRSSCELRLLRPDAALCWALAAAGGILALPGSGFDAFELVVMLTDITARKLAD